MSEVIRPDGAKEIIKYDDKKIVTPEGIVQHYRNVIIDTVSAPQNTLFKKINEDRSLTLNEWRDFGWEVYNLYDYTKSLGDTILVQILGQEGSGKTVGGKFLNPDETLWINADRKPLSFFGGRAKYPSDNSRKNYSEVADYDNIKKVIKAAHDKRKGTLIVWMLGHVDIYKGKHEMIHQRLRVLGRQATKLGIEGLNLVHTYYTQVNGALDVNSPERYRLETFTDGFNTARSPEGFFTTKDIPNNYQIIQDKILEDSGELIPKKSVNKFGDMINIS